MVRRKDMPGAETEGKIDMSRIMVVIIVKVYHRGVAQRQLPVVLLLYHMNSFLCPLSFQTKFRHGAMTYIRTKDMKQEISSVNGVCNVYNASLSDCEVDILLPDRWEQTAFDASCQHLIKNCNIL